MAGKARSKGRESDRHRRSARRALIVLVGTAVSLLALGATSAAAYTEGTALLAPGGGVGPSGVAVNQSSRDVYAAVWGSPQLGQTGVVRRYNHEGTDLGCTLGPPPTPPPATPGSVAVNPVNGNIYVGNVRQLATESTMHTFGPACGPEIGSSFSIEASQNTPISQSATDAEGNIYFPNTVTEKVEKITPTGTKTVVIEGLLNPIAVAFDSEDDLLLSTGATSCGNHENGRLKEFDLSGSLPKTGAEGTEPVPGLKNVTSLDVDRSTDEIFVGRGCGNTPIAFAGGFRVEKYDLGSPTKVTEFGGGGSFKGTGSTSVFNQLAVDETSGDVYVADAGEDKVRVYEPVPPKEFELTVTKSGSGTGTVTSTPAGINCGATCSAKYIENTEVTLEATADPGSEFVEWTGACSGSGTCKVTMDANKSVNAKFDLIGPPPNQQLTVKTTGSGTGSVTSSPPGISCPGDCSELYSSGTLVTLTATVAKGTMFTGWTGCDTAKKKVCTVTMNKAKEVTASFAIKRKLTVQLTGSGEGHVTGEKIDCPGACTANYPDGTTVLLRAKDVAGSTFTAWSGCDAKPNKRSCEVTMSAARTVQANYTKP